MSKIIFASILIAICFAGITESKLSKNSALRQSMFYGYDSLVKPDEAITVKFGISFLNLEYCPHKQVGKYFHKFEDILFRWKIFAIFLTNS